MEHGKGLALADAADVLSDQLRTQLHCLAQLLAPKSTMLDRRFMAPLRGLKLDRKQRLALRAITAGAAARMIGSGHGLPDFLEQVEYNGRRLAKLNVVPAVIVKALEEYDSLLRQIVHNRSAEEESNFRWVRDQLNFCILLSLNKAFYQVREAETSAFFELFRIELEARSLEELLNRFLSTLTTYCHADASNLYMFDEHTDNWVLRSSVRPKKAGGRKKKEDPLLMPAVSSHLVRRPNIARAGHIAAGSRSEKILLDAAWHGRYRSFWTVPLFSGERLAGVMQFAFAKPYEWLPREQELLRAAGERCMAAAEKAKLLEDLAAREEQVRELAEHMLHVEEVERRRISRELHDEAGQSLLCIRLQLEMLEQGRNPDRDEWRERVRETRELTERTILEIRRLIAALSPAVLEQLGLAPALRQLVSRFREAYGCRVRLQVGRLDSLPRRMAMIVYRLVQECCNNIAKHSAATNVNISVNSADGVLKLSVEDNGVGFTVAEAYTKRESFGLAGMRERVALLGGRFDVKSTPAAPDRRSKSGTTVLIELPVPTHGDRAV
ncbi:MAG: GAF domain-containing sensor histidine kinase [Bryobacterales bacterium]|nr:GAF domain-containing sensor histidine kinase [Bryobacterales bacterium]